MLFCRAYETLPYHRHRCLSRKDCTTNTKLLTYFSAELAGYPVKIWNRHFTGHVPSLMPNHVVHCKAFTDCWSKCNNYLNIQKCENVLPSGIIRLKKLTTGPGVGEARYGVGFGVAASFPVLKALLPVLQLSARASLWFVQSVKYINRKTSTRNQMREVTMTTRNVWAVRRFIADVSEGDAGEFSEMARNCSSLNISTYI